MGRMNLALQKLEEPGNVNDSGAEVPAMYSVVGLSPEIDITIYRKLGKWWVTGNRAANRQYWPGGYDSAEDALAVISDFFLSPRTRAKA